MPEITAAMAGCWFAGASSRTADELNVAVIDAALAYGWAPTDKATLESLNPDGWFNDPDLAQTASDAATEAESYLNGIAPTGYSFGFDDGFYLLPVCAHEWYERSDDDPCPHGEDCPNDEPEDDPITCLNSVDGHWYVVTYGAAPYQRHARDCATCESR